MTIEIGASLAAFLMGLLTLLKTYLDKKDAANKQSEDKKSYETKIKLLEYKVESLENRVNNVDGKLDKIIDELRDMNVKVEKFISNTEGRNDVLSKLVEKITESSSSGSGRSKG